jgi:hypothetical protein
MLHEGMILNDFLAGMHGLKDLKDLDQKKATRVTFSRRLEKDTMEKDYREEMQFLNLPPLEDFVRPDTNVTPRKTGYNKGHIRALLKVDTVSDLSPFTLHPKKPLEQNKHNSLGQLRRRSLPPSDPWACCRPTPRTSIGSRTTRRP